MFATRCLALLLGLLVALPGPLLAIVPVCLPTVACPEAPVCPQAAAQCRELLADCQECTAEEAEDCPFLPGGDCATCVVLTFHLFLPAVQAGLKPPPFLLQNFQSRRESSEARRDPPPRLPPR